MLFQIGKGEVEEEKKRKNGPLKSFKMSQCERESVLTGVKKKAEGRYVTAVKSM